MKVITEQNSKDIDGLKNKVVALVEKDDLDRLVAKLQKSIDSMKELNKTSSLTKDVSQLKELLGNIK